MQVSMRMSVFTVDGGLSAEGLLVPPVSGEFIEVSSRFPLGRTTNDIVGEEQVNLNPSKWESKHCIGFMLK